MKAVIKTVNPATLNFAQAVLNEARIEHVTLDQHASNIDGSIGAIPRRLMVIDEDWAAAIRALDLAGLEKEVFRG